LQIALGSRPVRDRHTNRRRPEERNIHGRQRRFAGFTLLLGRPPPPTQTLARESGPLGRLPHCPPRSPRSPPLPGSQGPAPFSGPLGVAQRDPLGSDARGVRRRLSARRAFCSPQSSRSLRRRVSECWLSAASVMRRFGSEVAGRVRVINKMVVVWPALRIASCLAGGAEPAKRAAKYPEKSLSDNIAPGQARGRREPLHLRHRTRRSDDNRQLGSRLVRVGGICCCPGRSNGRSWLQNTGLWNPGNVGLTV